MKNTDTIHSEQTRKRAENRYAILRTLQSIQAMKRTEVADYCGIRKSSVTSLVDELIQKKWVRLEDEDRPRSPLQINENYWRIISLQLDPDKITSAEINLQGQIISMDTYRDPKLNAKEGYLEAIVHCASKLAKNKKNIFGLSVSIPGMVDPVSGTCINAINLPDFKNVPVLDTLKKKFSFPIVVENDVRSSLYSSLFLENRSSALDSAIYVDITSGVGSTFMVNGAPYPGAHGTAGEIGHLVTGNKGRLCSCGQKDCLETYSSLPAICSDINDKTGLSLKTAEQIIEASQRTPDIQKVLDQACKHLAQPLATMISFTDPDLIILGNQPKQFYELIVPTLKKEIEKRQNGPAVSKLKIEIAKDHSSLRGVAALLMDQTFKAP